MQEARVSYVVAAELSCSTPAEWEGEHDIVTDLLRMAQKRKHGESQTSGQVKDPLAGGERAN